MALLVNRIEIPVPLAGLPQLAGGWRWGCQIFDPDTEVLIEEGPRSAAPPDGKLILSLPQESGPYRVFVSAIHEADGWAYMQGKPFLLVEVVVDHGRVVSLRHEVTTVSRLRRQRLRRSLTRAFVYPLRTLWRNRSLIRTMVRRDILGRYRGSFAGLFWTVLNPLLLMVTYFFVFGVVMRSSIGSDTSRSGFALYLLAGMLPWLAFSEAVGRSPFIMLEYRNFVRKLVFAVETLPFNLVLAGLVSEAFGIVLFVAGYAAARGVVHATVLWLPVLIIPQVLFTAGICWFLAALGVFVRDLSQIIGFILTVWFFITPICYPESSLPPEALAILSKNPMFVLVAGYRAVLMDGAAPNFDSLWKLWLLSIVVFLAGHAWFYKLRKSFADVI
jgi:lipopolysaccharide transport system permease protein